VTSTTLFAQSKTLQKTYSWKYNVSTDVNLSFNNYDCDLIIRTWDKSTIEYTLQVTAASLKTEDSEILNNYLENLSFHTSANHVTIDNRFWDERNTRNNKIKLELRNGEKITLTKFQISGELKVPSGTNFKLKSRYSNIEMSDISGELTLDLYNDKLYAGNAGSDLNLKAKYSTIEFENMNDITADIYNTDIEAKDIGNLKINSKYSKIFCNEVQNVNLTSYNDKLVFESTRDLSFDAKYSSLIAKKSKILNVDTYNCTIVIDEIEDIRIESKYSKFEFKSGGNCILSSSFNDGVKYRKLKNLKIYESKYGTYKIEELTEMLEVTEGYSDKFEILKTSMSLKGIKVNEKYGKVRIGIPEQLDFRLKARIKYPKLDIDDAGITTRIKILENSDLEYEGIKGTESADMPLILIKGYNVSLSINKY
jgi:hypothetical protein